MCAVLVDSVHCEKVWYTVSSVDLHRGSISTCFTVALFSVEKGRDIFSSG
jgi:hypothetical protein